MVRLYNTFSAKIKALWQRKSVAHREKVKAVRLAEKRAASVARPGIGRKILFKLATYAFKLLGVARRLLFGRDIRPLLGKLGVDLEPLFNPRFSVGLDRLDRAFRLAHAAIDAF